MKLLRYLIFPLFLGIIPFLVFGQEPVKIPCSVNYSVIQDARYDGGERNTFDLFLPETENREMPLVVFFHGGGFTNGDKTRIKGQIPLISSLLDSGFAFASVNYSYRQKNDSLGVQKSISDAARFIQFIRLHSDEYKIDKTRIGCYGESAGAGISLYLAFHDDLAAAGSENPECRESTRIRCAGAVATQSTYNLLRWKKIVPFYWLIFDIKKKSLREQMANFYGFETYKKFKPCQKEILSKLDMLNMVSPDDPPVWLKNKVDEKIKKGIPKNQNQLFHHPAHAIEVSKKARKSGIKNYLITNGKQEKKEISLDTFFKNELK